MQLSIVVVSHDEPDLVRPCVTAAAAAAAAAPAVTSHTVIVVANRNDSLHLADDQPPVDLVLRNRRPSGFADNVGRAIDAAPADAYLVLNPDVRIDGEALERLATTLTSDPSIAAVGPAQVDGRGRLVPSARRFPSLPVVLVRGLRLERLFGRLSFYRDSLTVPDSGLVDWVNGACMLIDAAAWRDIGPFDTGYRLYYEDIDWCDRAKRRGWKVAFRRDVTVIHDARRTSARWPPNRRTLDHIASIARYLWRRSTGRLDP